MTSKKWSSTKVGDGTFPDPDDRPKRRHGNQVTRQELDVTRLLVDVYELRLSQLAAVETRRGPLNPTRKSGKSPFYGPSPRKKKGGKTKPEEKKSEKGKMRDADRANLREIQDEARKRAEPGKKRLRAAKWACEEFSPGVAFTAETAWTKVSSALRLIKRNRRGLLSFTHEDLLQELRAYLLYQEQRKFADANHRIGLPRPKPPRDRRATARATHKLPSGDGDNNLSAANAVYPEKPEAFLVEHGFEDEPDPAGEFIKRTEEAAKAEKEREALKARQKDS